MNKLPKNQKNYSLSLQIAEWLHKILEENKEDLALIGITNETKLLEVLAKNGEQSVRDLLAEMKNRRMARLSQKK